jgi:hypothetical protein
MSPLNSTRMTEDERRSTTHLEQCVPPDQQAIFRAGLRALNGAGLPYVIEGAFLLFHLSGVWRPTKDLDVFVTPDRVGLTLDALADAGFTTWVADPSWLAKGRKDGCLIDVVFGAGNRQVKVDSLWYARALPGTLLGEPVHFCPPEESIAFKAFVVERHRFDGHDIAHVLLGTSGRIDWDHLLWRMGEDWELLLWHVLLFRYVYPMHADYVPREVLRGLLGRLEARLDEPISATGAFRGPLIGPFSYNADLERGYPDPRELFARATLEWVRKSRGPDPVELPPAEEGAGAPTR